MAGIARAGAVARRLAALAAHLDERAGAQVADRRDLAEQGVASPPQFLDVLRVAHGRTSRLSVKQNNLTEKATNAAMTPSPNKSDVHPSQPLYMTN